MPLAIGSLAKEVSLFARLRPLVASVGRTPLPPPSFRAAGLPAVALPTVAMPAHEKENSAAGAAAKARSERRFRRPQLHRLDSVPHLITIHRIADDRTDDCACGADDVAGLLSARVQKKTISDDR